MKRLMPMPFEIRRPFRLWMTGSIAVVMASVMPIRDDVPAARAQPLRLLRHSQFGVHETVRRLEVSARDQGLPALALLHGERSILVLASSLGGTPVVMQHADSVPEMPLSLTVRQGQHGGADVLVVANDWEDLPDMVASELASLPRLVDRALTAELRRT